MSFDWPKQTNSHTQEKKVPVNNTISSEDDEPNSPIGKIKNTIASWFHSEDQQEPILQEIKNDKSEYLPAITDNETIQNDPPPKKKSLPKRPQMPS